MPACSTYLSDLAEQKVTGNRKKANARHEQVVDQHACCVRGHRDNSRGNCGEQVHTDDEDEVDGPAATAAKTRKGGITDERN